MSEEASNIFWLTLLQEDRKEIRTKKVKKGHWYKKAQTKVLDYYKVVHDFVFQNQNK